VRYADVTRLLYRHLTNLSHTGIDRVNLEYTRWVVSNGGELLFLLWVGSGSSLTQSLSWWM